jgi:hypothetical protein
MKVYEVSYTKAFAKSMVKFYMESYFDIVFCVLINLSAFFGCQSYDQLRVFFATPLDCACSVITIFYAVAMLIFPIYGAIMIYYNKDQLEKKKVYDHLDVYLEGVRLDNL